MDRLKEYLDGAGHRYDVSYYGIVETFGYEILESRDFGSYQGDSIFILRDGEKLGLLVIAYGSCSGCDALEAALCCDDWKDVVISLAEEVREDINWSPTREEINERNSWYYNDAEMKSFILEYFDL